MESINIGNFDTLVTLEAPAHSRGRQGELIVAYSTVADVYGELTVDLGESVGDDNFESIDTSMFTTYKVAGLTTRWRAVIDGKPYGIIQVDMMDRLSPFCRITLRALDA